LYQILDLIQIAQTEIYSRSILLKKHRSD